MQRILSKKQTMIMSLIITMKVTTKIIMMPVTTITQMTTTMMKIRTIIPQIMTQTIMNPKIMLIRKMISPKIVMEQTGIQTLIKKIIKTKSQPKIMKI